MTIRNKILIWFLLPSLLIAVVAFAFCYFYTKKTFKQNIFDQLKMVADMLHNDVRILLTRNTDTPCSDIRFCKDYQQQV
ncbi:MAG: hypothetical protein MRK02_14395 [Candidatus Scalindua sp.]|nr:hypothetical protein [Candidatus Scalindua sp.]